VFTELLGVLCLAISVSCGGPTAPSAVGISAIAPPTGSTFGGTAITIVGTNFADGATVNIGTVPATSVTIESPTRMTAVTGQSAAGTVDVVVSSRGRIATLPRAFTYSAPMLV